MSEKTTNDNLDPELAEACDTIGEAISNFERRTLREGKNLNQASRYANDWFRVQAGSQIAHIQAANQVLADTVQTIYGNAIEGQGKDDGSFLRRFIAEHDVGDVARAMLGMANEQLRLEEAAQHRGNKAHKAAITKIIENGAAVDGKESGSLER